MPLNFPPKVPIVGQSVHVIMWYPTAILQCKCGEDNSFLIVVTGFKNVAACGHCGKGYMIEGLNPQTGDIHVRVMTKQPPLGVVQ